MQTDQDHDHSLIQFDVRFARDGFQLNAQFSSDNRALAVFGPSGAGKSTMLAMIAGLLRPDVGRIAVNGRVLVDTKSGVWVAPHRRQIRWTPLSSR